MLKTNKAFSSFSVNDLAQAKDFYNNVLHLDVQDKNGWLELRVSGDTRILVYPKPNHTPASFTVLNFPVDDIVRSVADMKQEGVAFERYDDPGFKTDEDNIARHDGGPHMAWFTDPAGNIMSLMQDK
ncbi:VOC family protein [Chryseolinea lacunae]|uniref:VOC family protein n=1 Tax=Chryseolinea lacunae TaxID=2801331 RepID=A0ABS1L247_9BACT|nr:VOC family protein [Chryseolinea lacunae]MBL0744606.1 VOC family protein [Chryseolinea lacunae]